MSNAPGGIAAFTSEERFRILVEQSLTGVLLVQNGIAKYANERAAAILGYRLDEIVGRDTTEFVHIDDRPYTLEMRRRTQAGEVLAAPFEVRAIRKDGSIIEVEVLGALAVDATPTMVLSVLDVSAKKKTERLLSQIAEGIGAKIGEQFFISVVQSLTEVLRVDHALVAELQRDGQLRTRAVAIDGRLAEGVTYDTAGTPCREVMSADFCWFNEGVQKAFPHDALLREMGAESYAGAPLLDEAGKAMGVLVVMNRTPTVSDAATEAALRVYAERASAELRRLRHEREIIEEKTYLTNLMDTAHLLITELDMEGKIRFINHALEELTGWSRAGASGQPLFDILPPLPEDLEAALALLKPGPREITLRMLQRDGTERILRWRSSDVHREERLVGTILFAVDITESTMAAAEVTRMQETMRRNERMTAMGALVAGVAHEVRNPLFGISATVDAFAERYPDPQFADYLGALRDQVSRLNDLMRDLLEFSQPSTANPVEQDLMPILDLACRSVRPIAEKARVRVDCHAGERLRVVADRPRLLQVVENLLRNAIQHSPGGNVVEMIAVSAGRFVEIAVLDRGPGFAPQDLERLFVPFFTRRRGGVGLGLPLAQRIVEEHSGTIEARNRAGGGAEMRVRIPAGGSEHP